MQRSHFTATLLAGAFALSLGAVTGCVEGPGPGTVYASVAPPVAEVEVSGVAPGPDFVWIGGHHVWRGSAYAWEAGRWDRRPHARAVWHTGAWVHHSKGWYWRDGRWK